MPTRTCGPWRASKTARRPTAFGRPSIKSRLTAADKQYISKKHSEIDNTGRYGPGPAAYPSATETLLGESDPYAATRRVRALEAESKS